MSVLNHTGKQVDIIRGQILSSEQERLIWGVVSIVKESRDSLRKDLIANSLAEKSTYSSQDIDEALAGKYEIEQYLIGRFRFLRKVCDSGRVMEIFLPATVNLPEFQNYPCLVYIQDGIQYALWVMSVTDSREITQIKIITTAPRPDSAVLIGVIPSLEKGK